MPYTALIEATGREHIGQASQPWTTWNDEFRTNLPHPNDGKAMRNYTEHYEYDEVGNFLHFIHHANGGSWVRDYAYKEPSLIEPGQKNNRLSKTAIGSGVENYTYDAHGSMTSMPSSSGDGLGLQGSAADRWTWAAEATPTTFTMPAGQRVRKVIERPNGRRQRGAPLPGWL